MRLCEERSPYFVQSASKLMLQTSGFRSLNQKKRRSSHSRAYISFLFRYFAHEGDLYYKVLLFLKRRDQTQPKFSLFDRFFKIEHENL